MQLFENTSSIEDAQIEELFSKRKENEIDIIFKTLSLIIYNNTNEIDILEMYKTLDLNDFIKLIYLFDGKVIRFPTIKDIKESLVLSLVYYFREIKNYSWSETKEKFPFEISGISYGIKLKSLNNFIRQKMDEMLKRISKDDNNFNGEKE
jgi:hypothetical protein